MGGAALMLALGHVVMSLRLPLSLRLLVPAVENSVAGNAYRPLDVLDTRAGITIEQVRGASPPTHAPGGGERLLPPPPAAAPGTSRRATEPHTDGTRLQNCRATVMRRGASSWRMLCMRPPPPAAPTSSSTPPRSR